MSIHDRPYWRRGRPEPGFPGAGGLRFVPVHWLLLGATFVAYLVQAAYEANEEDPRLYVHHLGLSGDGLVAGEFWQPLSYLLLHDGPGHLFWNLLALWFFGSMVEEAVGRRRTLLLYLGAGLAGGAGHVLAGLVSGRNGVPVVGASGAIMGLLVYAAFQAPTRTIILYVFPIPLWVLASLYVGGDALMLVQGKGGGVAVAAHLGGAAAGALAWFRPWAGLRRRRRPAAAGAARSAPGRPVAATPGEGAEVDRLLERIHASGIGSLSEAEREFLERVSRKLRDGR